MKEIKFRAWDGDKYISPDYIDNNGHAYMHEQYEPPYKIEVVILEQFTGLRDKNGREIYEGDKVAVFRNGNRTHEIITVEWHDNGYHLPRYISLSMDAYDDMDYEVIGNIHENPEVLK